MNLRKSLRVGLVALLVISLMLLSGCEGNQSVAQNGAEDWISGIRTGIARQGISEQSKFFEVTDDRVYFLINLNGYSMVFYGTHYEDNLLPLCSLEDCMHIGNECDAYFPSGGSICCYDDFLYVTSYSTLYRMNLDGTDCEEVIDVLDCISDYDGIAEPRLWNGILTLYLSKYKEDAFTKEETGTIGYIKKYLDKYDSYYYKLDGSMDVPLPMDDFLPQYNDGSAFIMRGPTLEDGIHSDSDMDVSEFQLYEWNPENNHSIHLYDATDIIYHAYRIDTLSERKAARNEYNDSFDFSDTWLSASGPRLQFFETYNDVYWGTKQAIYLQQVVDQNTSSLMIMNSVSDNLLCKTTYEDGATEILLETGLRGTYRLSCFPDCFVLSEITSDETVASLWRNSKPKLYFYNWNFELLGQYFFEESVSVSVNNLICGESADRIYIATQAIGVPEYYIEKADFETGEIKLHELKYVGVDLDKVFENN